MTLSLYDEFAGAGGSTQGAASVPGVEPVFACNHNVQAVESHSRNFPAVDHYCGDVVKADITRFPRADLFWASPSCPWWTDAAGRRRDFDRSTQQVLFGPDGPGPDAVRSRALMEEIPRYLAHWATRGRPVLAGVVENVVQCRLWDQWNRWLGEIRTLGYHTRMVALNSMHAASRRTLRAPQSRDRLYVAYWLRSLGRVPDWDKWLRPQAWCPACEEQVTALQVFKIPGRDMGRYRTQYAYRCPHASCRHQIVEPDVLPAAVAIDWTLPGQRIGDRKQPLAEATMGRIRAGLHRYALPVTVPTGGTWRTDPQPVTDPLPARTTRENDALAVPPLLVPVEGRADHDRVATVDTPIRSQTCRNETGLAWLPFLTPLRGGSDRGKARSIGDPLHTFSAKGTHHGLAFPAELPELAALVMRNNTPRGDQAQMCTPAGEPLRTLTTTGHQSLLTWAHLLMPYYGTGRAHPVDQPIATLTSRDRYALASAPPADLDIGVDVDVDDVLFRMLQPHEIGRGMAFGDGYIVLGDKRAQVRQYGNAVTPPAAEVIVAALVEAITGEDPYEAGGGG
jgi:DNA (cytosine-5)-methyltransferase 1